MAVMVAIHNPDGSIASGFWGLSRKAVRHAFAQAYGCRWRDIWKLGYRCRSLL